MVKLKHDKDDLIAVKQDEEALLAMKNIIGLRIITLINHQAKNTQTLLMLITF